MAIVYSYEQATTPALGDLLLGTDVSASGKPTKSFSIQSIVDLVGTNVPGGGTVTSIDTTATTFISLIGGRITTTGSLSASLSATGVPSATTYLRGDNVWAIIPDSNDTTYSLSSAQNNTSASIRLSGSDSSQTLITLAAGNNITLVDNGANNITISSTGDSAGVTSVTNGAGISITGSPTLNPTLALDYVGSNNYIKIALAQTTPISTDIIAFDQASSSDIKTTTLSEIPITALEAVKTYVDAGDAGDIRNNTDTFVTTAAVNNVVSLTSAEYAALATKNANTLYIVVAGAISYINTLNVDISNITGTEYTINPSFDVTGSAKSGITGASYDFDTRITANPGFEFNPPLQITNASGVFGNANATVNTTTNVTAVQAITEPPCIATLSINTSAINGQSNWYTLGGNPDGYTSSGPCPLDVAGLFNVTISANANYGWTSGPDITYVPATGEITGNTTITANITGTIAESNIPQATATAVAIYNFTGDSPTQYQPAVITPNPQTGDSPYEYNFNTSIAANPGYAFSNLTINGVASNGSRLITDTITANQNVPITFAGQINQASDQAIVNLSISNQINGIPANTGYTITTDPVNLQQQGSVDPNGFNYSWTPSVNLIQGYEWENGTAPQFFGFSGTTTTIGEQTVTGTISGANCIESVGPTIATLRLTYNITQDGVLNPPNPVWSPSGNIDGDQQSAVGTLVYDFTNISPGAPTITIPANYQFDVPASTTPSVISGSISVSQDVNATVQATISEIPVSYYTLQKCSTGGFGFTTNLNTTQLTFTLGDIVLDTANSEYYTVVGETSTQGSTFVSLTALTSCPAQLYYWNAIQCSGTGTVKISTTNAGISAGDSYTYNSVCYRIVDSDPTENPAYNIDTFSGCCTANVNVNFTNNVSGKANTTTTIADGTTVSATGIVGQQYTITNSISANSGYEFTSGPNWSTGATGTVTGAFVSGTTEINQNVTGTVIASGVTVYNQQITAEEDGGFGTPSTTPAAAKTELCFQALAFSAYSEDANITDAIQLNARWFADSGGSNPFSGGFKWYGVGTPEDLGAVYIIRLSDAGVVTEVATAC